MNKFYFVKKIPFLAITILAVLMFINAACKKESPSTGSGNTTKPPPPNQPPVANAGSDQIVNLPNNIALLDGSVSFDPENSISSNSWAKISGPVLYHISDSTSIQTQISNLTEGVYKFELKVTDAGGLLARDTIVLTVKPYVGQPPVAKAGPDQLIRLPVNSAMLNGSASFDPDGTNISFNWTKISGPSSGIIVNANGAQTMITGLTDGVYQFELKITDADGFDAYDLVTVIVDKNEQGTFNFYNVQWSEQGCFFFVKNIYSIIPSARPFKVFLGATDFWSDWFLIHPILSGSSGFYYQVINGDLKIISVGIDCGFDSGSYAVRIVMQ